MWSLDEYHDIISHLTSHQSLWADKPATFLIDGTSGAGKTTLADQLATLWQGDIYVLHMDDIYPGWDGLAQATRIISEMLAQRWEGNTVSWHKYDWSLGKHTDWMSLAEDVPLLIEGCGSMPLGSEHVSHARLWCDAPLEIRKKRALSRGGEDFDTNWDNWEQQYRSFMREQRPQDRATRKVLSKTDTLET